MGRNIEIKARLRDRSAVERTVLAMGGIGPVDLTQEDTFFPVLHGRLKLRVINGREGELIQYDREDSSGPRTSTYSIFRTSDPNQLKTVLADACGVRACVRKQRRLYMLGNTRVHLDTVESLGNFIELEVVLGEGESDDSGMAIAKHLMQELAIGADDLIDRAYVDLLPAQNE